MSQQQFSYFDPEQETIYEPRLVNHDPRESQEYREEQEETVYYVTPEQSMLKGEKLVPAQRTTSHVHWIATAIFLLMILFGGFLWAHEVLPASGPPPYPYSYPQGQYAPFHGPHYGHPYWEHDHQFVDPDDGR